MLNNSGESGHPCLVPDFRGNAFNFSPLKIMLAVGFIIINIIYKLLFIIILLYLLLFFNYIAFIMLTCVPSMPAFWRVFFLS